MPNKNKMVDILELIKDKSSTEEIEDTILSNLLSYNFYLQIIILMDKSPSYFVPMVSNNMKKLLSELSLDDEILDYHSILKNRGYELVDKREYFVNNEMIDELQELDLELVNRINLIGNVIREF